MFNSQQIEYMKSIGISADFISLSDNDCCNIEDIVSDRLQIYGFDDGYEPTNEGKLCESILDTLEEMDQRQGI